MEKSKMVIDKMEWKNLRSEYVNWLGKAEKGKSIRKINQKYIPRSPGEGAQQCNSRVCMFWISAVVGQKFFFLSYKGRKCRVFYFFVKIYVDWINGW